ncbi:GMC family oxidoreductase [Pseudomonas sp. CC6-YY-74]|uniref:GMC family oxidoreductase n=1 Tax=Pseudomonas sp. CC6-YY-74 TaxID=1930532 RepID=UPI0009A1875F|nr:GMC family oxidoreductase [Pseudomonas sp. CC6-YY-74]
MTNSPKVPKEADVLIIGSGPSGAVTAKLLTEAGMSVVTLEQGTWFDPGDYPGDKKEFELASGKQWHPSPNVRDRERDYPINTSESDVEPLMQSAVGGSATIWAGHWVPFLPSDFKVWSLDGVAVDWPFDYYEVLPHLEAVEKLVSSSGTQGNPSYPAQAGYPTPQIPIGKTGMKLAEGMDKMGWHWWPGLNAMPSIPWQGQNPCARRGTCMFGCPEAAKWSPDLVLFKEAKKYGHRMISGARVSEIIYDDNLGRVTGAIYIDQNGRKRKQMAKSVVLCANAIGTPRILLNSKSKRFPDGLANSSGLVGKNLMMHPFSLVMGHFEENIESWYGPSGQLINSLQFYETDKSRGFVRGAKWGGMAAGGPLSSKGFVGSEVFSDDGKIEDSWGDNWHQMIDDKFGKTALWAIVGEDLPEESNRVVIDDELVDSDGIPAPKVIYKTSENSRKLLEFNADRAEESLLAAGAKSTSKQVQMRESGWHLLGTTRMGNDPKDSVLNQYGQSHDVPNLYVFDLSAFPTGGGVNPTATLMAVAHRQATQMIKEARKEETAQ